MAMPPSKAQMCSREYLPLRKSDSEALSFQLTVAICSDMGLLFVFHQERLDLRVKEFRVVKLNKMPGGGGEDEFVIWDGLDLGGISLFDARPYHLVGCHFGADKQNGSPHIL